MVNNSLERTITLMPFTKAESRQLCDKDVRLAESKGDLCYLIYKEFIAAWKKERRWTTAHELYKTKVVDTLWLYKFKQNDRYTQVDAITALHLAWQVFFADEVMPYEQEMKAKNGEVL